MKATKVLAGILTAGLFASAAFAETTFSVLGNFTTGVRADGGTQTGSQELGRRVAVDSSGNVFIVVHSTTAAIPSVFYNSAILKRTSSGGASTSVVLSGDGSGQAIALDSSDNVYAAERDVNVTYTTNSTGVRIVKFNSSLLNKSTATLAVSTFGAVANMLVSGSFLYVQNWGGLGQVGSTSKYTTGLVFVSSVAAAASLNKPSGLAIDAAGGVYSKFSPFGAQTASETIYKYDNNLTPVTSVVVGSLLAGTTTNVVRDIAISSNSLFVVSSTGTANQLLVQRYTTGLVAENVSSTFTGIVAPLAIGAGVAASPDGALFVAVATGTAFGNYLLMKYDPNLNLISSSTYAGLSGGTDQPFGMAVLNSTSVYVTGASFGNSPGDFDAATALMTVSGLTAPISAATTFTTVDSQTVTVAWNGNGNSSSTVYIVENSTSSSFATANFSSSTLNTSAQFGTIGGVALALRANTSHYFRVMSSATVGGVTSTSQWVTLGSTVTLAMVPSTVTVTGWTHVYSTGVMLTYKNPDPYAASASSPTYEAQVSTNGFITTNYSMTGLLGTPVTVNFQPLASNTTYYFRARATSWNNIATSYSSTVSTVTFVAQPTAAAATTVGSSSVTFNWSANGNSTGTYYTVQVATTLAFVATDSAYTSSNTYNVSLASTGLSSGRTYYARVRAVQYDSYVSTWTALAAVTTSGGSNIPTAAATPFTSVAVGSVTVSWGANSATEWRVQIATASDFSSINYSSVTANTSVLFGSLGAVGPGIVSLSTNTVYYFQVQSTNSATGVVSPFLSIGSTSTLAVEVTTTTIASAIFRDTATVGLNWLANGNPSATEYNVQLSTSSSYATVNVSSRTLNTSATFYGLVSNTTFYVRVQAINNNNVGTTYAGALSTATFATTPTFVAVSAINVSSLTANWGANGNLFPGTTFVVTLSTVPGFVTTDTSFSSATTFSSSVVFGSGGGVSVALAQNTTYYLRVSAVALDSNQGFATLSLSSASTLAAIPTISSATPTATTLVFSWATNSNSTTTFYNADISTSSSFASVNLTQISSASSSLFTGLAANTTYYGRVKAVNNANTATAYSALSGSSTWAAVPVNIGTATLGTSSFTVIWSANNNASGTVYQLETSSMAYGVPTTTTTTSLTTATLTGLTSNTGYANRVRALGNDGGYSAFANITPGATTQITAPTSTTTAFTLVNISTLTAGWTAASGSGINYNAIISTNSAFVTTDTSYASSNTAATSVLFGAGGGAPNTAVLLLNTTYYVQVQSSMTGTGNTSAYFYVGSTWTLANPPVTTTVLPVSSTTATLDWSPNGNSNLNPESGTRYEIWRASDTGFGGTVTTDYASSSTYVSNGLAVATTYYFKVRTVSNAGPVSVFDSVVSTMTLGAAPGTPGTPTGTALGISSITWVWTAASGATSHRVFPTTATATILSTLTSPTTTFTYTGLVSNSTFSIVVAGVNANGQGVLSTPTTVYTLADVPAAVAQTVWATSATVSWNINTNSTGTPAYVERSTSTTGTFAQISSGTTTSFTDVLLYGCTTYAYRIRNANGAGAYSNYTTGTLFTTEGSTPSPAGNFQAQPTAGNKVALTWSPSPSEGVTSYRIYYDSGTGTVDYNTVFAQAGSSVASMTTAVLNSTAAYKFAIRTINRCGVTEANTDVVAIAASTATLSTVRASIYFPLNGADVAGGAEDSVGVRQTVTAQIVSGSLSSLKRVLLQFRVAGTTFWTDIPSNDVNRPNPATVLTADGFASVAWNISSSTLLGSTTLGSSFDLRAVARDTSDVDDTAPSAIRVSVVTPAAALAVIGGAVTKYNSLTGVQTDQLTIGTLSTNTMVSVGTASDGTVRQAVVTVPANTFASNQVTLTISPNPAGNSFTAATGDTGEAAGVMTSITATEVPAGPVTIVQTYPDLNSDDIIDGTLLRADGVTMFSNNGVGGGWLKDVSTSIDRGAHTISAITTHFSFFAAFGAVKNNLDTVRVYPVPFRPNGSNPDEGMPFSTANGRSGILFDNLPRSVTIKIYTLTGGLITSFTTTTGNGAFQWDVRNDSGRNVASGVYFAVISTPGVKSVVKRLAIIR